jgi:hypothetical protein
MGSERLEIGIVVRAELVQHPAHRGRPLGDALGVEGLCGAWVAVSSSFESAVTLAWSQAAISARASRAERRSVIAIRQTPWKACRVDMTRALS